MSVNIGIHSVWRKASDRALWQRIVDTAILHHGARHGKSSISIWGWGWVIEDRVSFRDRLGFKVKLGLKLRKRQMLGGEGGVNVPQSYRPSHGPAAAGMQPD